jgi:hypothetical protein
MKKNNETNLMLFLCKHFKKNEPAEELPVNKKGKINGKHF